jgi:hypothetical protein
MPLVNLTPAMLRLVPEKLQPRLTYDSWNTRETRRFAQKPGSFGLVLANRRQ